MSSPSSPSPAFVPLLPSPSPPSGLLSLPEELLSLAFCRLEATDLVALECVSARMRALVTADDAAWRVASVAAWGKTQNVDLMGMAAESAGGWKRLFADKKLVENGNPAWSLPSAHEVSAICKLVKGRAPASVPCVGSPMSVMEDLSPPSPLQVVMLIDGSSSVTEEDFSQQRNFCKSLILSLRETHGTASVALIQFNQYPKVHLGLTKVSQGAVLDALSEMQQLMGSTDVSAPLRRSREMLADDGGSGEKAIVLLTDGQTHSEELKDAENEAQQAAVDSGARLFTLGVGRDVDESGLRRVCRGASDVLEVDPMLPMATGHYFPLRKMNRGT